MDLPDVTRRSTWRSAGSLVVLIVAGFLLNMKPHSVTSAPIATTKHEETAEDDTELPNMSSVFAEQPTADPVVPTETEWWTNSPTSDVRYFGIVFLLVWCLLI